VVLERTLLAVFGTAWYQCQSFFDAEASLASLRQSQKWRFAHALSAGSAQWKSLD
jgi:hypothetical protein